MASVLYSSARAVVMEKTLLGEDRLKRMLEGTADDALKILSEVGFGTGDVSRAGIDAVSDTETARLCSFIKETAPDDKIKKFFLLPYDFKNAEALIKEK
ncbi:MAG: V-type ATPase subunit, partial [Clostridia bacterium]|nr:V-type ATPase subunit [Clostridia bacterium]